MNQEIVIKNRKMLETLQELFLKGTFLKVKNTV